MPEEWIDPLHFVVNSSEQNDIYFNMALACFACLLHVEESGASAFVEKLDEFSVDDFINLRDEMRLLDHKDIELNESKVIILVSALHYVCYAYLDDTEEKILAEVAGENKEDFLKLRNRLLYFASRIISYVKPNFLHRQRFKNVIHWLEVNMS